MIPVFVASSKRFSDVEWLTEFSIKQNTDADVAVYIVRPDLWGMCESGCTGFTNVRWAVPQLCRELGYDFGIYLDVDMLVTGDICELWTYRRAGHWVCLQDGSDEVSVICASLQYPDKSNLHNRHKGTLPRGNRLHTIPLTWNSEDHVCKDMRLLHFTALDSQPWFYDHPDPEAVAVYRGYCERYHSRDWPQCYKPRYTHAEGIGVTDIRL